MAEKQWDRQLKNFFERASKELERTGEALKVEAARLMEDLRDPVKQQKMRDRLREFGGWAKKTADQAADAVDRAVEKAETAWKRTSGGAKYPPPPVRPAPASSAKPPESKKAEPAAAKTPTGKKPAVKKTVGKRAPASKSPKKTTGTKPAAAKKSPARPKSIGKKKPAS